MEWIAEITTTRIPGRMSTATGEQKNVILLKTETSRERKGNHAGGGDGRNWINATVCLFEALYACLNVLYVITGTNGTF